MKIDNELRVSKIENIKKVLKENGVLENVVENSQRAKLFGMRIVEDIAVPDNEIWYMSHGKIIDRFIFKK